jgi:uncharacterized membrane protein
MLWWWNDYWPWMLVPLLMMLICGVMMFSMMGGHMGRHRSHDSHAMEILKERFASGEITRDQYEEQRRLLQA